MQIPYIQDDEVKSDSASVFSSLGITHCFLKYLCIDADSKRISKKDHHHNTFEIHILERGMQEYLIGNENISVNGGEFLFIPPFVKHRHLHSKAGSIKFAICFNCSTIPYLSQCVKKSVPPRFFENMRFIIEEQHNCKSTSKKLIEHAVFESSLLLLRIIGLNEETVTEDSTFLQSDFRVESAKAYIEDNIEGAPSVGEVAEVLHISPKQLTRLFLQQEGITPAKYIVCRRVARIHNLLVSSELPLKAISEQMSFQNEYNFNSFVKKNLGMPPGTYRKMSK